MSHFSTYEKPIKGWTLLNYECSFLIGWESFGSIRKLSSTFKPFFNNKNNAQIIPRRIITKKKKMSTS